jgi:SAM-dependent methyltransferase/uncharacterized protein YbaR (Trm112 family)
MDPSLLDLLRCPVSGGALTLNPIVAETRGGRRRVRTGVLTCAESRLWYPVINFVPVMLTFVTPLVQGFARDHAAAIAAHPGFVAPDLAPMPGERSVQRTFTEEWGGLAADTLTFIYDDAELEALHRDVWLRMDEPARAVKRRVLDVGCGYGREASILARLFTAAQVVAVDLNLALVAAGDELADHPRLDPVVASLFRLPFVAGTMDHVHSQGVLHHTWSTEAAFAAIEKMVAPGGSLFIWLYAAEDSLVVKGLRGAVIRAYWLITHRIFRPVLSRSPGWVRNAVMWAIAAVLHPLVRMRDRRPGSWGFQNTLHGLRDAFTPRYAHQHGFNEVLLWFERAGYRTTVQSPLAYEKLIGKRLLGVGVRGDREG